MLAVYAIVNGNEAGWTSTQTLAAAAAAVRPLVAFFDHRDAGCGTARCRCRLFRLRNVAVANVVGVLWARRCSPGSSSRRSTSAGVGYSPCRSGLAFLPANLDHGGLLARASRRSWSCASASGRRCRRARLAAVGLLLFSRAPVEGNFVVDVLPAMLLLGLGRGIAFNPVLLAAMSDVKPQDSGLASGVVNTVVHDGRRTRPGDPGQPLNLARDHLAAGGAAPLEAMNGGFQIAFAAGAVFAALAAVVGGVFLRPKPMVMAEPDQLQAA